VGLIDVLPTLCDYLGLDCPKAMSGRSWLHASPERRWLAAEGVGGQPRHRAIRNAEWKLQWEPGAPPDGPLANPYRLYHISLDPGEREDLAESNAPEVRRALERLEPTLHGAVAAFAAPARSTAPIDPELEQRLRGLGYLEEKK
jgi:arylsulfatase A-like enzyme